jgi:hypothetical protein
MRGGAIGQCYGKNIRDVNVSELMLENNTYYGKRGGQNTDSTSPPSDVSYYNLSNDNHWIISNFDALGHSFIAKSCIATKTLD